MAATTSTKRNVKITPARVRELKALANRIDAQEKAEIKAQGRQIFAQHAVIRSLVAQLKERRVAMELSLAEVAERTGIAKPNLSRLENDERGSPTLLTLQRYAAALGMKVHVQLN